jgi:hypothetical protein
VSELASDNVAAVELAQLEKTPQEIDPEVFFKLFRLLYLTVNTASKSKWG